MSNDNEDVGRNIKAFIHCRECLNEIKSGEAGSNSPRDYARFSIGWTALGFQAICNRHNLNVLHVDFEGQTHPADQSREGDFGATFWQRVEERIQ